MMRNLFIAVSFVAALVVRVPLAEAKSSERLDLVQALDIIVDDACRQAFADDADAVQACIDQDPFGCKGRTTEEMALEDDNQICVDLGGILRARMTECARALRDMEQADSSQHEPGFFRALGDTIEFCSTQWLCIE